MYSSQALKEELSETLIDSGDSYDECDNIFTANLNKHTPEKKQVRGSNKAHENKELRYAIMKTSILKNKADKTKKPMDISNFKKHCN